VFLKTFYSERTKIVDTHAYNKPPNGANRVKQWLNLLEAGELDLKDACEAILQVTDWDLH
jgi:chitosanase